MKQLSLLSSPASDIHIPPFVLPTASIRLVSSLGDKVLFDHIQPAHSYTRNFYNYLLIFSFRLRNCAKQ